MRNLPPGFIDAFVMPLGPMLVKSALWLIAYLVAEAIYTAATHVCDLLTPIAVFAGTNVNYNVNWTYGGDHSKPNKGYAALHGCQGDTVTFNFAGGPHNVVLLAGSVGSEARHYCSLLCFVPGSLLSVVQEGLRPDFHSLHLFLPRKSHGRDTLWHMNPRKALFLEHLVAETALHSKYRRFALEVALLAMW